MLVAFAVTALLCLWLSRLGMPLHQLSGGCGTLAAERLRLQPTTTVRILNVYGPKEFGALNELLGTKVAFKIKNV